MQELCIEKIDLNSNERLEVEGFLSTFNLFFDKDIEYTVVAKSKGEILGTCSYAGKVLKCFAVKNGLQGEGIASKLVTHITNQLFDRGIYESFLFTEPKNLSIFKGLNYHEVHSVEEVSLLEGGMANVRRYTEKMYRNSGLSQEKKAALVMNCNPFTLGHRYLIEKTARENKEVVVFIVEENRSLFPFEVRLDLVKRGTEDLENVYVLPGGSYIISSTTFPSYFLRQEGDRLKAYTKLDAGIFAKYIAPVFNIEKRYIGTEPYCKVTSQYNEALLATLPQQGIEVVEVDRLNLQEKAVSASEVRRLIRREDWCGIEGLVHPVTYKFLRSEAAKPVIEKIKRSDSPH
ncbi:[citrate (pro-3S)-lyase] ligase [Clostridium formicaceticum]|uniref:[Citrate [pro-3S]-lyase] ligase n=1 Tax=Clostridium formicaceticum TaxID=1497 RepID=A0AAC9RQL8_9CLOT|nr:[citrate (pro-3S)-lyase] ligase [Clostridium formicaceticum]AOY74935.1 [citrate (pro-3S)-lyase] ligase [Clostridium formicaceticum]ARE89343.1 [Citrate [pro-3S]-lyase] ligase [Clostridium formicaceticum]